MIPIRYMKSML